MKDVEKEFEVVVGLPYHISNSRDNFWDGKTITFTEVPEYPNRYGFVLRDMNGVRTYSSRCLKTAKWGNCILTPLFKSEELDLEELL